MAFVETEDLELGTEAAPFWTPETLRQTVEQVVGGRRFVVVSNREPYIHRFEGEEIVCERPVSGMVAALEPVMRVCGGSWVAHGSGNADRNAVDAHDRVAVPPGDPAYALRRVWLTKGDEDGYYYGFANQALWPLCHIAYHRPLFDAHDWEAYVRVNRQFARAVLDEVGSEAAIVLIQDYHFALLGDLLRQANPDLLVAQFWHIPWPNRETFRVCPWAKDIVEGLLGNDLLGFHIRYHCRNFLEAVAATTEARVDDEGMAVTRGGRRTLVRPFPVSLDIDALSQRAMSPEIGARADLLRSQLGVSGQLVMLGVDRIDYTKGIPERLRAFDILLERHREFIGKVRFVQIGSPSRTRIPRYQELGKEIESLVGEINWKYAQDRWSPITLRVGAHGSDELLAYYRLADVCVASSLHDGMNLVAKEYISARADGDGVLVLSQFTGAARELDQSLQINPYAAEDTADVLYRALCMPAAERRRRMLALRDVVARRNVYRWAGKIMAELGRIAARRSLEAPA